MPSIPVDVLREILEHVHLQSELATLCRVNKIFCSCSQDVLYRYIYGHEQVIPTLAQSTDLARRVRVFTASAGEYPDLAMALRNMSSLRILEFWYFYDASILDGCTFKLDSFTCNTPYSESLQNFLNNQPSLTHINLYAYERPLLTFDVERCLPNLTRIHAHPFMLRMFIPGRPVREVMIRSAADIDLGIFTLSTAPIQKLFIHYNFLYPKPVSLLVSMFPFLVHLDVNAYGVKWTVRVPLCLSI